MWRRFNIYQWIIGVNFLFNIIFYPLNEDYFKIIPKDIAGYMFWSSLGLWLGFELCKYEFKRLIRKNSVS